MNDEIGCFLCFGSLVGLAAFLWLMSEVRAARKLAQQALAMSTDDVPTMARQLYDVIHQLERRVAALEARLDAAPAQTAAPSSAMPPIGAPSATSFARPAQELVAAAPTEPAAPAPVAPVAAVPPAAQPEPSSFARPAFETPPAQPTFESSTSAPRSAPAGFAPQPPVAAEQPTPRPQISLEQWLGVRGAAVAGAVVLAIAAVYFFRYSVEHGLISPATRVALGTLLGLGCIAASEIRFRKTHKVLAEYLAGAGAAILYLAFWAAGARYHLVPSGVTSALLVVTTLSTCALAYVRSAAPVAVLGLLGGFATPLLLSTGDDRPIALFAYLMMLDVALLLLARRRAWVWLAAAALGFTFFYQASWIGSRLDAPRMGLGVVIVLAFSALFAFALPRGEAGKAFRGPRIAAILLPSLFALYFGASADLGANFGPTLAMLLASSAGGAFLARDPAQAWMRSATASAAVVSAAMHFTRAGVLPAAPWLATGTFLALLLVQAVADELRRRRPLAEEPPSLGFDLVLFGALTVELFAASAITPYAYLPRVVCVSVTLALATAESVRSGRHGRMLGVSALVTLLLGLHHAQHGLAPGFPPESVYLAFVALAAASLQAAPLLARWLDPALPLASTRASEHGAGLGAAGALLFLAFASPHVPIRTLPYAATASLLLVLASLVATRMRHGGWLVATMTAATFSHLVQQGRVEEVPGEAVATLIGLAGFAVLAAGLPLFVGRHAAGHVGTYRAASLAGPSVLFPALFAYKEAFGSESRGLVPLVLSLLGLGTLGIARMLLPKDHPSRTSAFAWSAVAALSMVSIAIPAQLRNEWVTVGWALQGAAIHLLYKRLDHAGIKYYAAMLLTFVTIRLVFNDEVLRYHPPSGLPVLNWIAYTYLVPVACLVYSASVLGELEMARYRDSERSVFPKGFPLLASLFGVFAVAVGFVFINLTVIDAFAVGRVLELPVERRPARDLVISLAWALYATTLLAIGMWRKSTALRSLSLGLVLLTCLKVFLYDLGNLQDLYRVASLLGLAVALIGISLAYKRFVFRDAPESRG